MGKVLIIGLIGCLAFAGCTAVQKPVVGTPLSVAITQAEETLKDNPDWGIGVNISINAYVPGNTINGAVVVHNGNDATGDFALSSEDAYFTFPEGSFTLAPMETQAIPYTFIIPQGTSVQSGKTYSYTVDVNKLQTRTIKIAYHQRFYVTMR